MANIEQDLQAIMNARYGKDVRQSIHDAISDINDVNEANISTVQGIADTAQGYANTALQAKTDAQTAQTGAETAQTHASNSAEDAEAWAVGKRNGTNVPSTDPTYENNSKYWQERANYWYQQAQAIAESFSGALRPMGTVTFANLPPLAEATAGDMYNVSDEFTTTSDFKEGAGHVIPLGSNVYKTTDDKWDVLAGSPVTGIKGDSEQSYRKGNVNITKANIGLGNVDNESLGSADISAIGDGSVKGAISSLKDDKQFIFDQNDFVKLGLSDTSSFSDICNKLLTTPYRNSEILLWVNNATTAGATIKSEIDNAFSSNFYGYAVFKGMRQDFVQITAYTYTEDGSTQGIFQRNYNKINTDTANYSKWAKLTLTYASS